MRLLHVNMTLTQFIEAEQLHQYKHLQLILLCQQSQQLKWLLHLHYFIAHTTLAQIQFLTLMLKFTTYQIALNLST